MSDSREHWYEDEAGPLVRLYAVARGRADRAELDMTSLVVDTQRGLALTRNEPEYAAIVRLCAGPISVAEVSAHLHLPLTMTKVLIGDLLDDGRLVVRSAPAAERSTSDLGVLRAVLDGIRAL
ncbi:DUF742 domain-containing protein [Nocardia huaxiensis]|uniref:DUF742 domain-containing protein n=1 Tax=Nocardia huaxiensis TaxID=2755382 RepID=A0A7D6ZDB6_9NOCA|nr:DUF742 domain-containing protein [Nocardia huaxiensis]QLY32768.1 DUF742 domain-containing protein [Nocardia huaxiensis]UFS93496.1 DUF742 domain-containing protein [Nocardia huaxiensis]